MNRCSCYIRKALYQRCTPSNVPLCLAPESDPHTHTLVAPTLGQPAFASFIHSSKAHARQAQRPSYLHHSSNQLSANNLVLSQPKPLEMDVKGGQDNCIQTAEKQYVQAGSWVMPLVTTSLEMTVYSSSCCTCMLAA